MKHIIHRLLSAASDAKLRQDMNVEDEYFSAIENRDTAIMMRDQKIAEQDAQLEKQSTQLQKQHASLLASARLMKSTGVDFDQIAAITGLEKAVIANL